MKKLNLHPILFCLLMSFYGIGWFFGNSTLVTPPVTVHFDAGFVTVEGSTAFSVRSETAVTASISSDFPFQAFVDGVLKESERRVGQIHQLDVLVAQMLEVQSEYIVRVEFWHEGQRGLLTASEAIIRVDIQSLR